MFLLQQNIGAVAEQLQEKKKLQKSMEYTFSENSIIKFNLLTGISVSKEMLFFYCT